MIWGFGFSRSGYEVAVIEYQREEEVAWYPDGDTMVRHEYNPLTAYAFGKVFGPQANTMDVYDVAARPLSRLQWKVLTEPFLPMVLQAVARPIQAGTIFAYGVTSSGKTHTMHGDQEPPGIIPLAIKDVFKVADSVLVLQSFDGRKRINIAVWGPLNQTIVSGGEDTVLKIWDAETEKLLTESDAEVDMSTLTLLTTYISGMPVNAVSMSPLFDHV
ncbi:unnamed protein product [Eruca vesicaria subsp. sativa]|uniref:Kinesin motor domain-containing protein n=1 Tax=Eruca vesicaria subsp. sativa TaxID=29727 RepID=A0ABC8L379_ERUVS|nr:unnamed protein product [Eruca vesicaria subsp. sativa]